MNPEFHAPASPTLAANRLNRSTIHRGSAVAMVMLIAGCSGGSGGPENPPPPGPPAPPAVVSGLDVRPTNTSCLAPERAASSTTLGTERVFPNLVRFTGEPVQMLQVKGDSSRWFIVERFGFVRSFENRPDVTTASEVLNIDARVDSACAECGLLSLAFHPDWPSTPRAYVTYTSTDRTEIRGPDTHLSEFSSTDGGLTLDPDSERIIFNIPKVSEHHHGGSLLFGTDGYLYMSTGDGAQLSADNGQRLTTLKGKILRIDIRGTTGTALYRIPPDNPFAASTTLCNQNNGTGPQNCPEIYAWGFRNPWRMSFDRGNGDLWVGDVGESDMEEVNRVSRGGNYGWRCFEGTRDVSAVFPTGGACAARTNLLPPVAEYTHQTGNAVSGGIVYRGNTIPGLVGHFVFGDFPTGRIWEIRNDTQPTLTMTGGLVSGLKPSSFNEGNDGEIYITNMYRDIRRITGAAAGGAGVATQLSATGCVNASNATLPASGLIPYAPNAPFWSDGAVKERWMALPDGKTITVGATGDWDFPNGTVLMKNFRLDNRLIETRLFMRHPDGIWAGYTYEWNAGQTDATLVRGGKRVTIGGQTWIYPSEGQCVQCHTEAAGWTLGLETKQLASTHRYPSTGRDANQLVTLNEINALTTDISNPTDVVPYPNPTGTAGTLGERARAYLHSNCSQCHRPSGGSTANMDLRYSTALADTHACDVAPGLGDLGIADARLIAPGAAARSVVIARMSRRDAFQMPVIGSAHVDADGAALLTQWVNSLTSCN
jgi:uncharacterized repeat protein (TIGR03806 family)